MVSNNNRTLASVLKELETLKDLASSIEDSLDEITSQQSEIELLNTQIDQLTKENRNLIGLLYRKTGITYQDAIALMESAQDESA